MKNSILKNTAFCVAAALAVCACCKGSLTKSGLDPKSFKSEIDSVSTALFTLTNKSGMEVCLTNFGARIVSIMVPDRDGNLRDVVHGFDNVDDYVNVPTDFGATIGRFANRIAYGKFTIDSTEYQLPLNNNGHTLHGGPKGWQYVVFTPETVSEHSVKMTYNSVDGEMGFPGTVQVTVSFTLTEDNSIDIEYRAETDKPTVINMTNHSYFNLSGDPTRSIVNDLLYINADKTTPADEFLIPTGEIADVAGTPFDFRTPKTIAPDIDAEDNEQIRYGHGFDHNWILNTSGDITKVAATLLCPETGIKLDVYTTEPGIQVYCGNFLDGTVCGKHGVAYQHRTAICLESQHYPDSPNKENFPSVLLRPGEKYSSSTIFVFGVQK